MHRRMKDLLHRAGFHGIALMHNQHPIGNVRHHPHIVGDENHPISISCCNTLISCRIWA